MTKRIILHIGMPKCATTSLQAFLAHNRKRLAARGFLYDPMPGAAALGPGNAGPLALAMFNGEMASVKSLLEPCLRQDLDVILSSEDFYGLASSRILIDTIDHIRRGGFEISVICFLRRQDLWIESDYKQHVQGVVDWRGSLSDLLARRESSKVLNYNAMLHNWARSAGVDNILAIPLQERQSMDHVLRRFLAALSAEDMVAGPATGRHPHNVSPPTGLIEPARYLKKARLDQGHPLNATLRDVRRFLALAPERVSVPARKYLLSTKRRTQLVARFHASNETLSRTFMREGDAFGDNVGYDAASETDLAEEAAEVLACYGIPAGRGSRLIGLLGHASQRLARRAT